MSNVTEVLGASTSRRTVVATGAKIAYTAPLVAATMSLAAFGSASASGLCTCPQGSSWSQTENGIPGTWNWTTNHASWSNGDAADLTYSCDGNTVTIQRLNSATSGCNGLYTGTYSDDCSSVSSTTNNPCGPYAWSATVP